MRRQREGKGKKYVVYFIIAIMVLSVFGVIFFEAEEYRYGKHKFSRYFNYWSTAVNKKQANFNYLPEDVIDIETEGVIGEGFLDRVEIDVTADVNSSLIESYALAAYELSIESERHYGSYVAQGFTIAAENSPIITCDKATALVPVIYFREENSTKIIKDGDCIIIEANNDINLLRAKDKLLYINFGILK